MRISDWSSDVCSSDLAGRVHGHRAPPAPHVEEAGAGPLVQPELAADQVVLGGLSVEEAHLGLREVGAGVRHRLAQHDLVELVAYVVVVARSEEHTSELQSLMRISYAVFCLKKKKTLEHTTRPK